MNFVALDVETANPNMASICQIGVARFADGVLADEWKTYVDPQDYFDGMNVTVHGINENTVRWRSNLPSGLRRFATPHSQRDRGHSHPLRPYCPTSGGWQVQSRDAALHLARQRPCCTQVVGRVR